MGIVSAATERVGKNVFQPSASIMKDGFMVKVSRDGWPAKAKGTLTVYGIYGKERRVLRGPVGIEGGDALDKDGKVATHSWIGGTWPGRFDKDDKRTAQVPDSIECEIEFDQAVSYAVEFDSVSEAAVLRGNR